MTYIGPWSYHTVLVESIMSGALSFKKHIYSGLHCGCTVEDICRVLMDFLMNIIA